ncbi:hypothetical protein SDC9_108817 [bioreactor metagenome]|uniref:PTS EIIA type-4 domain-containing protein n=1 Tax=bioreactor metagenome TaxID=1076179 RepID=A0A645BFJ3_9ZZZZ
MVKYLLASHGLYAEGTASFLKIMAGTNANLYTLAAFLDDTSIEELVRKKLEVINEYDQLIVFCDLYGGSVAQEVYRQTQGTKRNIQIIAGYNVALVLDIILKDRVLDPTEIRQIIAESRNAIVYLNDYQQTAETNDLF